MPLLDSKTRPRVGFIISHPFQYQFYSSIAKLLTEPVFVLEQRKATPFEFSETFIQSLPGHVVHLREGQLKVLDGRLDVIFCMTPKHLLVPFETSKTVSLQYSFAKEVYQYGPWRCAADLNLMQGPFSYAKVTPFAAAEVVGNPRYDGLDVLPRGGGGILYMPTYGELSSLKLFVEALPTLPPDLRIRVKIHHVSEFEDEAYIAMLREDPRVEVVDGYANALPFIAAADLVVSDYSGSIFDAVYLDRPIALIQHEIEQTKKRTDAESIEIARAADIGPVAATAAEIAETIRLGLLESDRWRESRQALKAELFAYEGRSAERIVGVLGDLLAGKYEKSLAKRALGETYLRYIKDNRALRKQLQQRGEECTTLRATLARTKEMTTLRKSAARVFKSPFRLLRRAFRSAEQRGHQA